MAKIGLVEQAIQKCGFGAIFESGEFRNLRIPQEKRKFWYIPCRRTVSALQPHEQANSEKTRQNMVLGPGHSCQQSTGEKSGVETLPDARRGRQVVSGQWSVEYYSCLSASIGLIFVARRPGK